MAVAPTYPGVYIEEIPSGVRTITGVSTSVAAFIDFFRRGPMNEAVRVFSMGDFEREFGGLEARSEASYGVQQFFLNGGTEAWIVRTASGDPREAKLRIADAGGGPAIEVRAVNPGTWGNCLRVVIDHPIPEPETAGPTTFNMTVALVEERDGELAVVRSEVFRNLSMNEEDVRYVEEVVNDDLSGSKLVRVEALGENLPRVTGTLSEEIAEPLVLTAEQPQFQVEVETSAGTTSAVARLSRRPETLAEARALLESAIRAARPDLTAFSQANVSIDLARGEDGVEHRRLRVVAGPRDADARIRFAAGGTVTATLEAIGLDTAFHLGGRLSGAIAATNGTALQVSIGGDGPHVIHLSAAGLPTAQVRDELEAEIRAAVLGNAGYEQARVLVHTEAGNERLLVLAGAPELDVTFDQEGADATVDDLKLRGADSRQVTALVSDAIDPVPEVAAGSAIGVALGAGDPHVAEFGAGANNLHDIATELQSAVRGTDAAFGGTIVAAYDSGENRLALVAPEGADPFVASAAPDGTSVGQLGFGAAAVNVREYALGAGEVAGTAQLGGFAENPEGADGLPPDADALIGDLGTKTGLHALEDVDLFNILCVPRVAQADFPPAQRSAVIAAVTRYCENRRAFFLMDTPEGVDDVQEAQDWLEANATLRSRNAALYFPRVMIADPLNGFRLRSMGASGTIAGLYARTDAARGVWKAPAGTEATLVNVQRNEYALTDRENGALNPLGINCLRTLPVYGNVAWGARTLVGADQMASEWKYVPVRRLALFLEESLYRGTKWVVFEPNDEPLWAQIRLNLGAFMHSLFSQGAFQGRSPREAYLVKCDRETTTQNDIDLGRVNIVVGFAPLKPAEFVIIKIQQLAGAIQT